MQERFNFNQCIWWSGILSVLIAKSLVGEVERERTFLVGTLDRRHVSAAPQTTHLVARQVDRLCTAESAAAHSQGIGQSRHAQALPQCP